jgi:hypothetical protein
VSSVLGLLNNTAATRGEICPETVGCTPACWRGLTEAGGRDSVQDLANEQEISLSSNNIRDNRAHGFLPASEDPRDSLPPIDVVGE